MAAYPNTAYDADASRVTPRESLALDVSDGGDIRGRVLTPHEVYDLVLVHKGISESDADTIESFYATNRTAQIDVTWRGDTYYCRFVGKPDSAPFNGGVRWVTTSRLVGKRSDGA